MQYAAATSLLALCGHLERLGVKPAEIVDRNIIATARRRETGRVPAALIVDALNRCAERLGDPLFGLRHGQQLDPSNFGPVSLLWRYAPSIRYSNRVTVRILHLQHEGVAVALRELDDVSSILIYRAQVGPELADRQFIEAGVSFMLRVCRLIMGVTWTPQRVTFAHQPIVDVGRYSEILGSKVEFGTMDHGLVVTTSDLDRRSPAYDADILTFVERSLLHAAERDPLPFRERLDRSVDDMLALGVPQLSSVAGAMAMSTRTIQRHLALEGLTFRELLTHRRRRIVENWSAHSPRPSLSKLAEQIAFSEGSAASRFLRRDRKT